MAALVMSGLAAGSASAAQHLWLINGQPIVSPVKIHSDGLVELEDTAATLGAVRVECTRHYDGTVGPGALYLVLNVTLELLGTKKQVACNIIKAGQCKQPATAEAINLPWHTELTLINGEVRYMIMKDVGTTNPGWAVTCNTIIGNMTDTCTIVLAHTGLDQINEGVKILFDKGSPKANCTQGGSATGIVEGSVLLLNPSSSLHLLFD